MKITPAFVELLLEGGRDRNRIEHRVDRDARALFALWPLDAGEHASRSCSGMPSFS